MFAMIEISDEQMAKLRDLCREYGVVKLDLFGSAARDDFDPASSDIDLAVRFDYSRPMGGFMQYFGFKREVEALFARPVDLVCEEAVQNRFMLRAMNKSRKHLYAA
jgi:predicted nucleotidyltransferase